MKQTMKRITAVLVAVCLCMLSVVSVFAQQDGPDVKAEAYCVINRKDGSIVYSKNMDDRYYPASITKIMTALVTLEHCTDLDDTVVFNSEVMDSISSNSSTLNPVAILDEEMTVRDALFGLMLNSANECASALAVYTAGSIDAFVEMMNEKAQELGAVNTHYMNAHGLDDDDHYTTAHDMAIIFDAALKNDVFRYVDSRATYTIPATNKYGERNCTSTNQLINGARPYEGVYAGKTGRTLVTAAYRDGMDLICVIMKSDNDNFYSDTETLFDHAFLKVQGNEQEVYAAADDSVMAQNDLASGLNVRQYPSTSAPRIASLMPGDAVHRIGTFGNWSQVETPNGVGYVSSQYLIFQDGTPVGTYEVVNTLTDDQKSAAPVLTSQESDEAEVTSSEEAVEATQPESQAQENESNEAETNAQNQQVTTVAAGPTIPQQTYRYQLTINNLTMVIIGVIFAIAIVVAILAVTLIRRRNKDDDDDVYEQEAGNDEEKAIVPELLKLVEASSNDAIKEVLDNKGNLVSKSQWIVGGDGWAYDIGYGGLDHVIANNENVNILVLDTEVYSNTGGQSSKSSQAGSIAKFTAGGKTGAKKDLAQIAMAYGHVYVAQIAMGANPAQTIKAMKEAESYDGPSLIIAYAPCQAHGIKGGLANHQAEQKRAIDCGYFNLLRYDPRLEEQGKNPLQLDSKTPNFDGFKDYLLGENRFSQLLKVNPEHAEQLMAKCQADAQKRRARLEKMAQ